MKVFRDCQERIDKQLDVVKILKSIRNLRILSKLDLNNWKKLRNRLLIDHSKKNIVYLDNEPDKNSSDSSPED